MVLCSKLSFGFVSELNGDDGDDEEEEEEEEETDEEDDYDSSDDENWGFFNYDSDETDGTSSGYCSSDVPQKAEGDVILSRKAWTKFIDGCMWVVDDCRQIHAQAQSPFQGAKASLLNETHQPGGQKKFCIDLWNNTKKCEFEIPISFVTNGMQRQARQMMWEEAQGGEGLSTRTAQELQGSGLVQFVGQPNPQAPDSHFMAGQPQDLFRFNSANGSKLIQPSLPQAVGDLRVIRDVLHCWSDPECPQKPDANGRWKGCGPSVKHLVPDILIMATENSSNVRPPLANGNLPSKGNIKWKFPYLIVEIVGGKDEWHSQDTFMKVIQECSFTLHFAPRAYYMLIFVTEIRFGVVTRNIQKGTLDVTEEYHDLSPNVFPIMTPGSAAPRSSEGDPNVLVNNQPPPPASDVSVKLQKLACRVINAVLDMASLQSFSERACNDLRLLPNWPTPLPCSPAAAPHAQAGSHRGFKCFIWDRVQHAENAASQHARSQNSKFRIPRAPMGKDQLQMVGNKSTPDQSSNPRKCSFGIKEMCRHINDVPKVRQRQVRRTNNPVIAGRYLPMQ